MRWIHLVLNSINWPLEKVGLRIVPTWSTQWWTAAGGFKFWDRQYHCFYHAYNCGWPPYASERCVELALADAWLAQTGRDVVEIGAVTPYYWPSRIEKVVDPFDPHPRVTHSSSLFEVDLHGSCVLSLSTFEHIGTGEYGVAEGPDSAVAAFRKVFDESKRFLLTVPTGYNPHVDRFLLEAHEVPADVAVGFLVRDGLSGWRQEPDRSKAWRPYGDPNIRKRFPGTSIGRWANTVAVLERGETLAGARKDHFFGDGQIVRGETAIEAAVSTAGHNCLKLAPSEVSSPEKQA